jgi:2',3'-cyclic-nucleotide 2'-phosphodiesterase (5'-nucleotidase family)
MVVEKDGEKYGLIGIAPSDMNERVKMNNTLKDFKVATPDETIKIVQEEVNKLKAHNPPSGDKLPPDFQNNTILAE